MCSGFDIPVQARIRKQVKPWGAFPIFEGVEGVNDKRPPPFWHHGVNYRGERTINRRREVSEPDKAKCSSVFSSKVAITAPWGFGDL